MKKFVTLLVFIVLTAFAAPAFAAENPFTDVPEGHWAYDAVEQLAARGVASGYPDGAYKGAQPMTRYEMASVVGRSLAYVDMEKASEQDMVLLKKLVLEFKNELDALGVKVSDLDKRIAVLEDGVGGWKIHGIFTFDAKTSESDHDVYMHNMGPKNEFTKERLRFFLTKNLDENTYFYLQYRFGKNGGGGTGRGDINTFNLKRTFVDTKIFSDGRLRVGRLCIDLEDDYGLYKGGDALFGDFSVDGLWIKKSFGMLDTTAIVGRNFVALGHEAGLMPGNGLMSGYTEDSMVYVLNMSINPSEKFFLGASGYWIHEDNDVTDFDSNTYGVYAGYSFTPSVALKGIYYWQHNDFPAAYAGLNDSPTAWKAVLDVKQDALKFTKLVAEYSEIDNTFLTIAYQRYGIENTGAHLTANRPLNNGTTRTFFVKASQQWDSKWDTYLRFSWADYDTADIDDSTEWGVGIGYQHNAAVYFQLAYDHVDYGTGIQKYQDKESVLRLRTVVSF